MKRFALAALMVVLLLGFAAAKDPAPKDKEKKPKSSAHIVDSGSFGVFVSGKRVATEKFSIEQRADSSVASSELMLDENGGKPAQTSELQLAANGDILHYLWKELTESKGQAVVEPSNEFLVQHITLSPTAKTQDMPFLMPHSTAILDDYFFSHRQLLAWRYLASGCAPKDGKIECNLGRSQFGVLIPRQRVSMTVSLEFAGHEKVMLHGAERDLTRINLHTEDMDWVLWFDSNNRMVRITIPGENTEVIRD